ncbi:hypothetical protein [Aureimonas sp. SK2]|uniref:hypothetical protein n=1 Tax=Aureimonas sp. SK2 TaxID=3015992 RepID=UPI002443E992|nr:hypothetical protein [Aureimonas sp. SK2]
MTDLTFAKNLVAEIQHRSKLKSDAYQKAVADLQERMIMLFDSLDVIKNGIVAVNGVHLDTGQFSETEAGTVFREIVAEKDRETAKIRVEWSPLNSRPIAVYGLNTKWLNSATEMGAVVEHPGDERPAVTFQEEDGLLASQFALGFLKDFYLSSSR